MKTIPKSALRFMRLQQVGYEHAQAAFEEDFEIGVLTGRIACQYKKPYDSGLPSDERAIYYIRLPFDSSKVIVSRHPGIVEWFRKYKGIVDAPIVATARPKDVKGKIVYTSGINVGLLKYAQGAYIVRIHRMADIDFDTITAEEIEELGPQLVFVRAAETEISIDADISTAPELPAL